MKPSVLLHKVRYKVRLAALEMMLKPRHEWDMVRLGTQYGGWWVPRPNPADGIAVCAGAGLDVSFDKELVRLGYRVVTLDPTPDAVAFVQDSAPELEFFPLGLWDEDGVLSFRQDANFPESWFPELTPSGTAGDRGDAFDVVRVKTLVERLGSPDIGILKIDIEGAEGRVIADVLASGLRPLVMCVEYDIQTIKAIRGASRLLAQHGYEVWQIEEYNYTYVHRDRPIPPDDADDIARAKVGRVRTVPART